MNSDVDLAWAAGIVDGEGCITIKRQQGRGPDLYALHVIVGQSGSTLPKMLKKLRQLFGGNVTLKPKPMDGNQRRPYKQLRGMKAYRKTHEKWRVKDV